MTLQVFFDAQVASLERAPALLIVGIVLAFVIQDCQAGNVALNKPATANAVYSTFGPSRAVDGDTDGARQIVCVQERIGCCAG